MRPLPVATPLGSALPIGPMITTFRYTHPPRQNRIGCEHGETRRPSGLPGDTTDGEPAGCSRYCQAEPKSSRW